MIILRYLSREVLQISAAITLVLLLIFLSSRLIRFLEQAASGGLSPELVASMILWRVPSALELILPLALTLAVLMTLSRMNSESELAVLQTSGCSNRRLFGWLLVPTGAIAVVTGMLSLVVAPHVAMQLEQAVARKNQLTALDTVIAGRFQSDGSGRLLYAEQISADREELYDVFITEPATQRDREIVMTAQRARHEIQDGDKFLVLFDGYRYVGDPQRLDWEVSQFDRYLLRIDQTVAERPSKIETLSTGQLVSLGTPEALAVFHWRMSMPILVILMMPFAFILARSAPRQNRFIWMVPIMLLQFIYFMLLTMGQGAISEGRMSPWPGLLWVHLAVLALGVLLTASREFYRSPRA